MSVWVTEEVMRRAVRFCRSPWTPRSFLVTTSIQETNFPTQMAHVCGTKRSQPCRARSLVSSVRFYSQDRIHSEDLEEKESSPLADSSLPAGTTSGLIERTQPFIDKLYRCGSPSDVLDLTCQYAPTVQQISSCLAHMWSTTKKMTDEQRRYELQLMFEHPAFDRLLQMAMKSVGHMHSKDVAHSLLSMVNLGVPQNSRVIQTLLRTCQEKLNRFDEKSLSILASCLEHMENSPNVNALKEGMRLVVEASLPGIKKVISLQTMMRMLGKDAPLNLKRKLERKALSMTDEFSLPNSQYMISTMATMGFYSKPLLDICSKKITENLDEIPFNRLFLVLQSCRELRYRNLDLLTGISDYVTSMLDIWTNKQVLLFLSVFESLVFCPAALMEGYAKKVISRPDALTLRDLLCVLKVYSSLNYDLQHHRQQFLDSVSQVLDSYLPKISGFNLLKAVFYLCLLGHFPSSSLEQLLQSSTMEQFNNTPPRFLRKQERRFQTVDLCLRLDRPPLPRPLTVPASFLGDPTPRSPSANQWLSQSLQSVVRDQADTALQEMVMVENVYIVPDPVVQVTERELQAVSEEKRTEFLRGRIFPERHRHPETDQLQQ